jgi:type VI secretion system secreted protein Hcp
MANEFYVTIEGTKQGKLMGESIRKAHREALTGISFHYAVSSPRDVASGQASGKRQHQPIVFVKEWGAASPQLFSALVTNEVLKSVLFEFVKTDENGEEFVHHSIRLTSASISQIEQYIDGDPEPPPVDPRLLEKISLTFQRIDIENAEGKTSATDDLKGGRL